MTEPTKQQFEAYLDGLLTPQQRSDVEKQLREDVALKDALDWQQRIDESLVRLMRAPARMPLQLSPSEPLNAPVEALPFAASVNGHVVGLERGKLNLRSAHPDSRTWVRRSAIAAVFAIAVCGAWMSWRVLQSGFSRFGSGQSVALLRPDDFYRRKVAAGFKPYWVCKDAQEFASSFATRFGQPLLLKALPADVAATGIDLSHTLTTETLAVLMDVKRQPVVILVDRLEADSHPENRDPSLHVHRRVIGRLVLYEVSPFDKAATLDLFYNPDAEQPTDSNKRWTSP